MTLLSEIATPMHKSYSLCTISESIMVSVDSTSDVWFILNIGTLT